MQRRSRFKTFRQYTKQFIFRSTSQPSVPHFNQNHLNQPRKKCSKMHFVETRTVKNTQSLDQTLIELQPRDGLFETLF